LEHSKIFFSDWKSSIAKDIFFYKIVTGCLKAFVTQYIQRFTEAKPVPSDDLWKRMTEDRKGLRNCFNKWVTEKDKEVVKEEIGLIKLIQPIVQEDMVFAQVHFSKIVDRFQESALEIVDGLLAVRSDMNSKQRRDLVQAWASTLPVTSPVSQAQLKRQGSVHPKGTGNVSIPTTGSTIGQTPTQPISIKGGIVITPSEVGQEGFSSLAGTFKKLRQVLNETAEAIPHKARELRRQVTEISLVNSQSNGNISGRLTVPPSPKSRAGSDDELTSND